MIYLGRKLTLLDILIEDQDIQINEFPLYTNAAVSRRKERGEGGRENDKIFYLVNCFVCSVVVTM